MAEFAMIQTNGVKLRVALEGEGPLVLLVHGFPESWYSWRFQLRALAAAGFRAAAPDVRGYGGSDAPEAIEAYDMETITADMAGLADTLSPGEPGVIIGHDWGAPIAWSSALLYPDRFRAVAGLSVPYTPPGPVPAIDLFRRIFTDQGKFFYQIYFQDEGVAEAELEADPARTIRLFYYLASGDIPAEDLPGEKPHGASLLEGLAEPKLPLPWLTQDDVAYYAGEFAGSGFRGPLNRYRNSRRDHAFLSARDDQTIYQPSLFIGGAKDPVLSFFPGDAVEMMRPNLADLRGALILDGCGHWTQQERADDVNALLIDWLAGL